MRFDIVFVDMLSHLIYENICVYVCVKPPNTIKPGQSLMTYRGHTYTNKIRTNLTHTHIHMLAVTVIRKKKISPTEPN